MNDTIRILGISGSLRRDSYNFAALRAATKLVPDNTLLDIFELNGIPDYNQDNDRRLPARVTDLKWSIRRADAILFVTPEYNSSVPGVLKNAIDWASRPDGDNAWAGKPAAIMGASTGFTGTALAQVHLRQILSHLDMFLVNQPEVMIGNSATRFDKAGQLTDPTAEALIRRLLQALVEWTERVGTRVPAHAVKRPGQ